MARTVADFTDTTASGLVTQVNTALAALTNPTIRGMKMSVDRMQRRNGRQYRLLFTYDTGGAALATPFLIQLDEYSSMASLQSALNTFYQGNSYFFAAPFLYVLDNFDSVHEPLYGALTLYNTTAGASANADFTNTSM